ncbi:helix-turn-helix domain-containing protein [Oscillibacter sp. MSJ-2]|uniref:Helix-turn-helix domain-containing protein n=1 Tax=Dysosmobacter acutus TaxID=2841504 RepID=A0ABS6FBB8_9FIRM|nr:helix-turn-helix transcriptional regulator [Dysosmobacter acutus]MBU5626951.1 helix-turn-helix domain-containing protein [Dysosmobacter acutus]
MTLGEHIQQLRKAQGLSQEGLGAALGVSRQAVSKWETGQTLPDTANLLAMAELFGVSADELAIQKEAAEAPAPETPAPERGPLSFFLIPIAVALMVIVGMSLWFILMPESSGTMPNSSVPPPSSEAAGEALSDFTLCWNAGGDPERLSLGEQEDCFPFGTSLELTAREWVYGSDWGVDFHDVTCGALYLTYCDADDGSGQVISRIKTIGAGYETSRGIGVGSPKADLLRAYGDKLVYCIKEHGSDILVRHDCYYAFQTTDAPTYSIVFYMQDGHVAGLRLENMFDLGMDAYAPDNVSRFPVVDGEPDFSQRTEPEREEIDATRAVYIAFQTLTTDANLSGEEQYQCRRTIFENLRYLDWPAYGQLGEAGQEIAACEKLTYWLETVGDLSKDEILGLQMGVQSNLDGFYSENYSRVLANAFFLYPIQFAQLLADNENSMEDSRHVVSLTAYGSDLYPEQEAAAVEKLRRYGLSGREGAWADFLIAYMEAPIGTGYELPLPEGVY